MAASLVALLVLGSTAYAAPDAENTSKGSAETGRSAEQTPDRRARVSTSEEACDCQFKTRHLREGSRGDDVGVLQRLVTELGYPTDKTEVFSAETERDYLGYERATGLKADGVAIISEQQAIERRVLNKRAAEADHCDCAFKTRTLQHGMRGEDVGVLQRLVTELGYPIEKTEIFTSETKGDYLHYERSTGLTADGVASISEQQAIERRVLEKRGTSSSSSHVFPIRGSHSYGGSGSRYGAPRSGHTHGGQDMSAASGTPLVAVTSGRISQVRYQSGGAGYYLVLQGDDRYDYVYMHLRESASGFVSVGQRVRAGQQVGRVGSTGASTGPHLHFEMWTAHWFDGGHRIDPLPSLKKWDAYS